MIRLARDRRAEAIHQDFRGDEPLNRLLTLLGEVREQVAAGAPVKPKIPSKWKDSKDQLLRESQGKCAYCETQVTTTYYGDVEHYRPKKVYWWLAYVYDNYLASCAICNQRYKGADFAISGPQMPGPVLTGAETPDELAALALRFAPDPLDSLAVSGFEAAHRAEAPLIPNPYIDDPEQVFAWEVFEGIEEVLLIPRPDVPGAADIVAASERIFGLNRPDLKRQRYNQWENYRLAVSVVEDAGASAAVRALGQELIDSLVTSDSVYAGMVRYFEAQRAIS
ncbi:hypothetical protein [Antarctobacter sp.]|uniref:hypothetical protein n=1 Tax=Antarctobacter sp. TaxID=1872577 RepID=UPI002B27BCC2|nr:hypothetical protein [Antarctobacter sp.]